MANPQAEAYFNSLTKQQQDAARATGAAPGGANFDQWFQNAVNAGATAGTPTQGNQVADGGQGRANTGTSSFADMIRAKARNEGWSEDFARYSDAQIEAWKPSWDEGAGRFRSEGGGGALVEKPTECPPGTTLHGSKCIGYDQANALFGGGYGGVPQGQGGAVAAGGPQAPGNYNPDDPLQARLMELMQSGGGSFGGINSGGFTGGGGAMWQTGQVPGAAPAASPALAAATLNAFTPNAPSAQPAQAGMSTPTAWLGDKGSIAGGMTSSLLPGLGGTQSFASQGGTGAIQPVAQPMNLQDGLQGKRFNNPNAWWRGDLGSPRVA